MFALFPDILTRSSTGAHHTLGLVRSCSKVRPLCHCVPALAILYAQPVLLALIGSHVYGGRGSSKLS